MPGETRCECHAGSCGDRTYGDRTYIDTYDGLLQVFAA
jgi:hypothetical protein